LKKYIFVFTVSTFLLLYIKISSHYTTPSTQIIINTSSLNNLKLAENIENELSKIKGISSYEVSLQSNVLLVNYDDKRVNDKDILGVLEKWGCNIYKISFNPIFN